MNQPSNLSIKIYGFFRDKTKNINETGKRKNKRTWKELEVSSWDISDCKTLSKLRSSTTLRLLRKIWVALGICLPLQLQPIKLYSLGLGLAKFVLGGWAKITEWSLDSRVWRPLLLLHTSLSSPNSVFFLSRIKKKVFWPSK